LPPPTASATHEHPLTDVAATTHRCTAPAPRVGVCAAAAGLCARHSLDWPFSDLVAMGDTKKNLPLLRAVKEGKTSAIQTLIDSGEVDVNFQNHCACAVCVKLAHPF
jgi:hypothetical protein